MTRSSVALTLLKTTAVGIAGGFVGGLWLYFAIIRDAEAHAQNVEQMSRASYMCAAGMAASLLALLSLPAGALFGLCLGGVLLSRKRAAGRRPLP